MNVNIPGQGKVIGFYGADAQAMVHMEECGELIQAISKMRRVKNKGGDDTEAYYNLVEEMADVLICLEQIQETYGIYDTEIQAMVFKKCRRQEERIYGHV